MGFTSTVASATPPPMRQRREGRAVNPEPERVMREAPPRVPRVKVLGLRIQDLEFRV